MFYIIKYYRVSGKIVSEARLDLFTCLWYIISQQLTTLDILNIQHEKLSTKLPLFVLPLFIFWNVNQHLKIDVTFSYLSIFVP